MAKCTITFEDNPNGTYKVLLDPDFPTVQRMHKGGHEWTPAEGIFVTMMNHVIQHALPKKEEETSGPHIFGS